MGIGIIIIVIIVVFFIVFLTRNNSQTYETKEQVEANRNKFRNNEKVQDWAKKIAEYIEDDLNEDSSIYKEYHIRVFPDRIYFGCGLLGYRFTQYDIYLEFYFSRYNLPNINNYDQEDLTIALLNLVKIALNSEICSRVKIFEQEDGCIVDYLEGNSHWDESYIGCLAFEPKVTEKW